MVEALKAANGAGSIVQLGDVATEGAGVDNTIERLYARKWRRLFVFPTATDSADSDPDTKAKGADGRMYQDIQRQIALYCAPAEAAIMALPPAAITKAWRRADAVFATNQFSQASAAGRQPTSRTQRVHMHVRGWPNLRPVTAAPTTSTRARSKTSSKRTPPKEDLTDYVAAIVTQCSPDNIIGHEHPVASEETGEAAAKLRERYGPDAAPPSNTAAQEFEHGAPHKCWQLRPTTLTQSLRLETAQGGTPAAKLRKTSRSPPPSSAGDNTPRSLAQLPEAHVTNNKEATKTGTRATSTSRTVTFNLELTSGNRVTATDTAKEC